MNNGHQPFRFPPADFFPNQAKIPQEELEVYDGKHVAYSWDGTRIVASGKDYDELFDQLETLGLKLSDVVCGYVDLSGAANI